MKAAKHRHRDKVEASLTYRDSRRMWQGLRDISDYRGLEDSQAALDPSLAEEINVYFTQRGISACGASTAATEESSMDYGEGCALCISEYDVRRAFL